MLGSDAVAVSPISSIPARQVERENRLALAHIYVGTAALVIGAIFGLLQSFSRARWLSMPHWFDYYRMLTAHGVLMALVFTTFFICGLATFLTYRAIPRPRSLVLGWIAFWLMLVGTLLATVVILDGQASVLYTFYAPLKAHPLFYIGATILVVGTWVVLADILTNVAWFRRNAAGQLLPLVVHGVACTFVMWFIATIGVAIEMIFFLIPWSLGWTHTVNVMMTRMLFWYFGHPLVYFWIMGTYLIWYNILPMFIRGGKIFSDSLTRLAFLLLLVISTPVGIHHEFTEPGISAGWKWLHTMTTYGVVVPSIMTAFAMLATFELAAQAQGKRGVVGMVKALPWTNPAFSGPALGMLLFIIGGFGGIINASYAMDTLVHNTMWIVGHFHVTVGGPTALSFIGAAYWLVPIVTGRKLWAPKLALVQTYTWFVGMLIMSLSMHYAGLLGSPRRTDDVSYFGSSAALAWMPEMRLAAIGGILLFASILMFAAVALGTRFVNQREPKTVEMPAVFDEAMPTAPALDRIGAWGLVAIVLAIAAYVGPMHELIVQHAPGAAGLRTW